MATNEGTPLINVFVDQPTGQQSAMVCGYSAMHRINGIPAVEVIDMGLAYDVPCCQKCADFYRRNSA